MGLFSFFDRIRGSGEPSASSGDRSPYGEFWFGQVSARTGSGMRVSPDSALRVAAVYGRFYLSLVDPAQSATFPAPANLYCDVEVHSGGTVRSTETFIVPVVPDVSQ